MKHPSLVLCLVTALCLATASLFAQNQANPGFEKLKTLAGDWEGKNAEGKPVRVSYKVVSSGTAVLETLNAEGDMEMVTVYTRDLDQVAVTHYCAANNQPRMRTTANPPNPSELAFQFTGATNLKTPDDGHMHGLVLVLESNDTFTQKWTWREGGKPDAVEVFHFTRKQ